MATRHASERRRGSAKGGQAGMAGNVVFLLLALAVVSVVASVAFVITGSSAAPGTAGVNQSGTDTTSPLMANGEQWIPLRSQAPADIIAAARRSALFHESPSTDSGEPPRDLSRLGTPVLVRALRPARVTVAQVPDYYVLPILSYTGAATDAAELALNPSHTAVQVTAIVTYTDPRADGSIALLHTDQAVRAVASQPQEAGQAIGQPYLIYFPLDPQWETSQDGQPTWTAGGAMPADPIWCVPAADGQQYLAGNDGRIYTVSQLPLWNGQ